MTKKTENYSAQETRQRMEAALRGARISGHKPKDSMTPKRKNAQQSRKSK